jgi:hypothetical protein
MPRHHFVPQFLLDGWATRGQLQAYRWIAQAGKVGKDSVSVAKACQIEDLHAFFGLPRGQREAPERDFFTPQIDTPAHKAHAVLLADGVRALTDAHRTAWARFLVAFGARTPETLRKWGPDQFRRAMAQIRATSSESPEMRALERNVPLEIAMDFAVDPTKFRPVMKMHWWLRRFNDRDAHVLLGDRPLLSQPTATPRQPIVSRNASVNSEAIGHTHAPPMK